MAIHYRCRHCQAKIGTLEQKEWTDRQLGFDLLTQEERQDIIFNDNNGDTYVHIICENCQEMLELYPERMLWTHLIQ